MGKKKVLNKNLYNFIVDYSALIVALLLIIINVIFTPNFFNITTISNIVIQMTSTLLISLGMTWVIASGGIDISVGSVMALSSMVSVKLLDYGLLTAMAGGMLVGIASGALIGFLVARFDIQPMIVSMTLMIGLRGVAQILNDFKYVQEAMKYEASAFILKPINTDELQKEVQKICKKYNIGGENIPLRHFIEYHFKGAEKKGDLLNYEFLEETLNRKYFCVINLRCNYAEIKSQLFLLNFREKIEGIMRKYLPSDQFAEIEISSHGLLYCVMNSEKNRLEYTIHQLKENLRKELSEFSYSNLRIRNGGIYRGTQHILDSYIESFDNTYLKNDREGVLERKILTDVFVELFESEDTIIENLISRKKDEVNQILDRQKEIVLKRRIEGADVRVYLEHLFFTYHKQENALNSKEDQKCNSYLQEDFMELSIEEMFQKAKKRVNEICVSRRTENLSSVENNNQKIKNYILQNYENPQLSLSSISEYMALNASYLSTAFSRCEGITISNYILNIRIQKAEKLLLNSSMKISEISHCVGFINYTYFSSAFRRVKGMSPSEFRNQE